MDDRLTQVCHWASPLHLQAVQANIMSRATRLSLASPAGGVPSAAA